LCELTPHSEGRSIGGAKQDKKTRKKKGKGEDQGKSVAERQKHCPRSFKTGEIRRAERNAGKLHRILDGRWFILKKEK